MQQKFGGLTWITSFGRLIRDFKIWSVVLGLTLILSSIGAPVPAAAASVHQGVCVYYYGSWSNTIQARFISTLPEFIVVNSHAGPYSPSRPNSTDIAALKAAGIKVFSYVPTGGMRGFIWDSDSPANDRASVRQHIAAIAAEGDSGIYFDEGGLFSPVSGQTYQDSILDRTLASPGGISGNSRYNKSWGDSWAGYTVEDYLSYSHSLGLITCVGLDDYRASKLNANVFAVTDFVLSAEEYTTRPVGMAPAGSEIAHANQCWVLAYDGTYNASATNAALGYGFRAGYCCQGMSSLSQPAFENYMAAVTGGTSPVAPTVTTSAASGITTSGATLNGNLSSLGSSTSVAVSFEYGTTTSYGTTTTAVNKTSTGTFQATTGTLSSGTTYHFRTKAVGSSTVYGSDQTFTTLTSSIAPAATTAAASGITSSGATLNGNLSSLGSSTSAAVSFEYGTTTSYGTTTTAVNKTSTGTFQAATGALSSGTTYHFRTKAVGSSTVYGSDQTFTTLSVVVSPTVSTNTAASGITTSGATLNGNLSSLGSSTSVAVSFEYGTTTSYGTTTTAVNKTSTGTFQAATGTLSPGTTYHFRTKAVGSSTVYGSDQTFTTLTAAAAAPTIIANAAANITSSSAAISGSLSSLGTAGAVAVSFEYGTTTSYGSIAAGVPASLTVPGTFAANLAGLTPSTLYHYRAKATGDGIAYTLDQTFITAMSSVPAIPATGGGGSVGGGSNGGASTSGSSGGEGGITIDTGPGSASLTGFLSSASVINSDISVKSSSTQLTLALTKGTTLGSIDGPVLNYVKITEAAPTDALSSGSAKVVGQVYDLTPAGVTFSPPVTMKINYSPASIPSGAFEDKLTVAYWNGSTWIKLDSAVDTGSKTVSAKINRFNRYALIVTVSTPPAQTALSEVKPVVTSSSPAISEPAVTAPTFVPAADSPLPVAQTPAVVNEIAAPTSGDQLLASEIKIDPAAGPSAFLINDGGKSGPAVVNWSILLIIIMSSLLMGVVLMVILIRRMRRMYNL